MLSVGATLGIPVSFIFSAIDGKPGTPHRFPLIDLLGVITVDHVGSVPVGIFLREASNQRVIVPGTEVIETGFGVKILAAIAEGIDVLLIRATLVAKGIVIIVSGQFAVGIGQLHHVAMGVVEIIPGTTENEVHTSDVGVGFISGDFTDHIPAVQQIVGGGQADSTGGADSLRVVGIGDCAFSCDGGNKLIEAVVAVVYGCSTAYIQLGQQIAVIVVGIGGQDVGSQFVADFRNQPVVGVVFVDGGVGRICVPILVNTQIRPMCSSISHHI